MENIDDLKLIEQRLENPKDEADRLSAYGELIEYLESHVVKFSEAYEVYDRYRELEKDWTQETVSDTTEANQLH